MSVDITVPPVRHKNITVQKDLPVRMRDGVTLFADIYRPDVAEPLPVLLMRTPYDKSMAQNTVFLNPSWYARYGYMVVIQDCRGRYSSEGVFTPYDSEAADGHDTVEWAANLEGSNGNVAMYGFSYPGAIQLQTAATKPRGLKTIIPAMTASDFFDRWTYEGGAFSQAFIQSWVLYLCQDTARRAGNFDLQKKLWSTFMSLPGPYFATPVVDTVCDARKYAPYYVDWLDHDTYDDYWSAKSIRNCYSQVAVPVLHVGGWYDVFITGTINNFIEMDKLQQSDPSRGEQKLVIGPWHHLPWQQHVGSSDFGSQARNIVNPLQLHWLDRHMGYLPLDHKDGPKVQVFVLNANEWSSFDSWPPTGTTDRTYYLHSGGRANSLSGDGTLSTDLPGDEPWDVYLHDPSAPVLSQGGHSCCVEDLAPMGPMSQRKNEIRNDVLVYTSEVLEKDLTVLGLVKARFYASSTADDTDFAVMLCDVAECGLSINIVNSIVRASRRNSLSEPDLLEPEKVYEFNLDIGWTAALFRKGHRIRVTIASSNFPHFGRTPNTSAIQHAYADLNDWKVARQTIFHDSQHQSYIVIPTL
ncbi:MAG: CocE/NonD family hydrolase [Candidatus Obscuribacterales bacterium]|nr:CocE/NonD family hydrolase [Cyanobacteria bacterium SZAS LIN-5]RTL38003.1 MAG: CocE/NonD family hydrolase [Candidatus Melainabacteria bacterium]